MIGWHGQRQDASIAQLDRKWREIHQPPLENRTKITYSSAPLEYQKRFQRRESAGSSVDNSVPHSFTACRIVPRLQVAQHEQTPWRSVEPASSLQNVSQTFVVIFNSSIGYMHSELHRHCYVDLLASSTSAFGSSLPLIPDRRVLTSSPFERTLQHFHHHHFVYFTCHGSARRRDSRGL